MEPGVAASYAAFDFALDYRVARHCRLCARGAATRRVARFASRRCEWQMFGEARLVKHIW
jgi:hypothetical protein